MGNNGGNTVPRIEKSEHIGPDDTGDNIHAKRVAGYVWNPVGIGSTGTPTGAWQRTPAPLITSGYDDVELTNADANGNYQTMTFKSAGSTVQTLSFTYDSSSNIISIVRS